MEKPRDNSAECSDQHTETFAQHWNRCVYDFNRERVAAYRARHPDVELDVQEPRIDCDWFEDEFCVNSDCPAVADYCPVAEYPEMCRFRKPRRGTAR